MIFPVALLSAIFLFSASLGSEESCYLSEEEEDQCASVCYPIVKPMLRYFEKTNERDVQLFKCKTDYSKLQKQFSDLALEKYDQILKCQQDYTEVLSKLKDSEVKYAQLQSKQQEVDNIINQKNMEIDFLKDHIRELKEKDELATLTNHFREDIAKLEEIVKIGGVDKNNLSGKNVETAVVPTNPLPNISNQTTPKTETIDFPDSCPRTKKNDRILREIQLPGSDPFEVVCMLHSQLGSGWLAVYRKLTFSKTFNRTYEDYERGFEDVGTEMNDEFFIGLHRLHRLSSGKPHEVLFGPYPNIICDNFVVGDKSEGYEVKSIGNCTGHVWMIPKQGSRFSTPDRDEDGVPDSNLAKEVDYGWWFDPGMRSKNVKDHFIDMYIRRKN